MSFRVKVRPAIEHSDARSFALERHGEQDHGCLKIGDHLRDVVSHAAKHYDPHINIRRIEDVLSAAWLHDIIEDTDTTLEEVAERFGDSVEEVVSLLTDKKGRNRMERHLRTYHAIRWDNDATLIKLCDRRHNHERSIKHGEHYAAMYEREYNYFKFALWAPHRFKRLWEELDNQYDELRRMLRW